MRLALALFALAAACAPTTDRRADDVPLEFPNGAALWLSLIHI